MLELRDVCVHYGSTQVLWDVSMTVGTGQMIAVMGPNGSGKSTVFKAITGLVRMSSGRVLWNGTDLGNTPTHRMASLGISLVLERRRLFPYMTVRENVLLGAYSKRSQTEIRAAYDEIAAMLPILEEYAASPAISLSGGQQQLVAVARGLISRPKLLIMDEPFLGLSPLMTTRIMDVMREVNRSGVSVLFNEQNARISFANSHAGYLLQSGRVVLNGSGLEMLEHPVVKRVYLGH